jgi:cell division protease FtsH
MLLSDEEKRITAYHEGGHALVAAVREYSDPLHKVTIIPRGMALGLTMQLPIDDKHTYRREYLETRLAILMGGRVAEELFLNSMTTGAGNDIERASDLARKMVCEFDTSIDRSLWPQGRADLPGTRDPARLQRRETAPGDVPSSSLFVVKATNATAILSSHRSAGAIAQALLEREVLDANEVMMLIAGTELPARQPPTLRAEGRSAAVLKPAWAGKHGPGRASGTGEAMTIATGAARRPSF